MTEARTAARTVDRPPRAWQWIAAAIALEAVCQLVGGSAITLLLGDLLLVPAGLIAGLAGLRDRRRRRRSAAVGASRTAVPRPATAWQRLDVAVHGALLVNAALFAAALVLEQALPGGFPAVSWIAGGAVLFASACVPLSVLATWRTAIDDRGIESDADALRTGGAAARRVLVRWRVVRVSLGLHVSLALLALSAPGLALAFG